jgi:hypothetical protein
MPRASNFSLSRAVSHARWYSAALERLASHARTEVSRSQRLPGIRLAAHPTLTESRESCENRGADLSTRNSGMKSRVATITTVSALILADRALAWALLIAGVILIFVVVVPAVHSPNKQEAAQEVLRILLGRLRD